MMYRESRRSVQSVWWMKRFAVTPEITLVQL